MGDSRARLGKIQDVPRVHFSARNEEVLKKTKGWGQVKGTQVSTWNDSQWLRLEQLEQENK